MDLDFFYNLPASEWSAEQSQQVTALAELGVWANTNAKLIVDLLAKASVAGNLEAVEAFASLPTDSFPDGVAE